MAARRHGERNYSQKVQSDIIVQVAAAGMIYYTTDVPVG